MLVCHNLTKTYSDLLVVNTLSLEAGEGKIITLLGPSGCGKTTTLRLIAGFEAADSGTIEIAGQLVTDGPRSVPPERRGVGMVFQDYAVFPHLSVRDNVGFALGKGAEARGRVDELLDFVGLPGFGSKMPSQLSGGEQQRVSLARALSKDPDLLLLDEPFSNLDAALRHGVRLEVRDLLKERGITAVFVTHDQEEALLLGDEVAVMRRGRIEQIGPPEQVYHQPTTRFVAEFMGQSDFLPGVVQAGQVTTPIGPLERQVAAPDQAQVDILVRPDDITIQASNTGSGRVLHRDFMGMSYVYHVRLPDGTQVRSRSRHTERLELGTQVAVRFAGDHVLPCFYGDAAI